VFEITGANAKASIQATLVALRERNCKENPS